MEHVRGAAAGDGEGDVRIAVLVEDHVAGTSVREGPRHYGVVALASVLELDASAGNDPDTLDIVSGQVERDVAEAVDIEQRRNRRSVDELRLRHVEVDEPVDGK